jgi:adenylosuccinate lyase
MIERYTRPEMAALWSTERKLASWYDVELAVVEAWHREGFFGAEVVEAIRRAEVDAARVAELEAITRHDVAAFVQHLEEQVGAEHGRWIHYGLTSSDVLDTASALRCREACGRLDERLEALMEIVARRAREHRDTVMMGRSHGVHAELTTLGHKLAIWYAELERGRRRLRAAGEAIAVGKISGAVGTFATVPPRVEARVCEELGLRAARASSQIVQRDRHAELVGACAGVGATLEKIAVEIRHLQRTEVREVEERFHAGQKGSSAMPHKRNPVLSENVTGLARLLRSYVVPALENVALWHERDISHSSVERITLPDATTVLDFALHRTGRILDELVVRPEAMRAHIERGRHLYSSQHVLLALIREGLSRQRAYEIVQRLAMRAWDEERDFEELARSDEEVAARLDAGALDACFSEEHALRHIDEIIDRTIPTGPS